jgi:hypothetical protein
MTAYDGVHEQVPAFLKRQVLVKVSLGFRVVPSGIVTSSMNCATSQVWVGGGEVGAALVVDTASVDVRKLALLVGGTVGGFRIAAWVMFASTVWAAEVRTTSAPCVGVTLEGKLQADNPTTRTNKMEASRMVLVISLPPYNSITYLLKKKGKRGYPTPILWKDTM